MTIEQAVLENLRELPPDKQQEVLDFVQFLREKSLPLPDPLVHTSDAKLDKVNQVSL